MTSTVQDVIEQALTSSELTYSEYASGHGGPPKLIVELPEQPSARVEAIQGQLGAEYAVGQARLAANDARRAGSRRRRRFVAVGLAFRDEWIETLTEITRVGSGPAKDLAPAEPAGQVNVGGEVAAPSVEVFADGPHAGRMGVARVLIELRLLDA